MSTDGLVQAETLCTQIVALEKQIDLETMRTFFTNEMTKGETVMQLFHQLDS